MLTDIKIEKQKNLEYGANTHQIAQLYNAQTPVEYEVLNDYELSYNDIINLKTALDITSEFYDVQAVTVVKSGMPCGVALGRDLFDACQKAFDCDPISTIDSVVAFSSEVDENIAVFVKKMKLSVIVAPDYNEKALNILLNKEDLKVVKLITKYEQYRKLENYEITSTPFGILVQAQNKKELDSNNFKILSKAKPSAEMIEDAVFAWKVVKHAKSQAVVIAKDFKTLAISQGNTNQVSAVEQALDFACNESKDAILALDSEILTPESVHAAVQGRIGLIIQPNCNDKAIVDAVNKYNLVMINTGISNIRY